MNETRDGAGILLGGVIFTSNKTNKEQLNAFIRLINSATKDNIANRLLYSLCIEGLWVDIYSEPINYDSFFTKPFNDTMIGIYYKNYIIGPHSKKGDGNNVRKTNRH